MTRFRKGHLPKAVSDYACRGEPFGSQREADMAIEVIKQTARLAETPYSFVCIEGHWHASVKYA